MMTDHTGTAAAREWLAQFEGHTPGPWRAITAPFCGDQYPGDTFWVQAEDPDGPHSLAEVRPGCDEALDGGNYEANAALIAAAPEFIARYAAALDEIERLTKSPHPAHYAGGNGSAVKGA